MRRPHVGMSGRTGPRYAALGCHEAVLLPAHRSAGRVPMCMPYVNCPCTFRAHLAEIGLAGLSRVETCLRRSDGVRGRRQGPSEQARALLRHLIRTGSDLGLCLAGAGSVHISTHEEAAGHLSRWLAVLRCTPWRSSGALAEETWGHDRGATCGLPLARAPPNAILREEAAERRRALGQRACATTTALSGAA
jgi:hypothetical protein